MGRNIIRNIIPDPVWKHLILAKFYLLRSLRKDRDSGVAVYWSQRLADELDNWGEKDVWNEIKMLLINLNGKILDIACGTGATIKALDDLSGIDVHGFDISDFLIQKAVEKGIPKDHLEVCDAAKTVYEDNFFDHSYSIGSLEHIRDEDIAAVITESRRITRLSSFHMVPVSRTGKDEGWLELRQSYHNNSIGWWVNRFRKSYAKVYIIDSAWGDCFSVGKWFICIK